MTSNPLSINQYTVAQGPRFTTSPGTDFFLDKIRYVFVLCVAAGVSFCAYNLYQCYQFIRYPAFHPDNKLKLVKCELWLSEIQEQLKNDASADVASLLQRCEILLPVLKSSDKQQTILLNLVQLCAKNHSTRAYQLAQKLESSHDLFRAAQAIQQADKNFNKPQLTALYQKGFQILTDSILQKNPLPALTTKWSLAYAEVFHSFQMDELKNKALIQAVSAAGEYKNIASRAQIVLTIAKTFKKLGDSEQFKKTLEQALQLLSQITAPLDLIQTRWALAHAYCDCNMYEEAMQEFTHLAKIEPQKEDRQVIDLLSIAKVLEKLSAHYKTLQTIPDPQTFFDGAFQSLQNFPTNVNRFHDYLEVAFAYQNYKIQDKAQQAFDCALTTLESLPEGTSEEIESKFDLLRFMTYLEGMPDTTNQKLLQLLVKYYDQSSFDKGSVLDKDDVGISIFRFSDRSNLKKGSDGFFQKYFADLKNRKEDPCEHIIHLTSAARSTSIENHHNGFSPEQHRLMLKTAEDFISKVPACNYAGMLAIIAEGYLNVDPQKCRELFNRYARDRALEHFGIATMTAAIMGITYISPQAATYLSLGFGIYRLFRPL